MLPNHSLRNVHYFSRIDTVNGYGPNSEVGKAFDTGSNDRTGITVINYNKNATDSNYLAIAGWCLTQGGAEKYVWSADGGKTWNDVTVLNISSIGKATDGMINYTANKYGSDIDFSTNVDNASYQGSLNGNPYGIAADLSAYAGLTVNVTFAAVPATDPDSLCIIAHIMNVKVAE